MTPLAQVRVKLAQQLSDLDNDYCWIVVKDGMVNSPKEVSGKDKMQKSMNDGAWWHGVDPLYLEKKNISWFEYTLPLHLNDSMT